MNSKGHKSYNYEFFGCGFQLHINYARLFVKGGMDLEM